MFSLIQPFPLSHKHVPLGLTLAFPLQTNPRTDAVQLGLDITHTSPILDSVDQVEHIHWWISLAL